MKSVVYLDNRMIQVPEIVEYEFKGFPEIGGQRVQGGFVGFQNEFIRGGDLVRRDVPGMCGYLAPPLRFFRNGFLVLPSGLPRKGRIRLCARDWSGILYMPPLHGGICRYKRKARSPPPRGQPAERV
jgi:hypothetical protein